MKHAPLREQTAIAPESAAEPSHLPPSDNAPAQSALPQCLSNTQAPADMEVIDGVEYYPSQLPYIHSKWHQSAPDNEPPVASPMVPITIDGRVTLAIIDTGCAFTTITVGCAQSLFGNSWKGRLVATGKSMQSATGQQMNIIGCIPKVSFLFGAVEIIHDLLVEAQDVEDRILIANDMIYNRITFHEGKVITVRCKYGRKKEIIPISYGSPAIQAVFLEETVIPPRHATYVKVELVDPADPAGTCLKSFANRTVSLEQCTPVRNDDLSPDINCIPLITIDEAVVIIDENFQTRVLVSNMDNTHLRIRPGSIAAAVTPVQLAGGNGRSLFLQAPSAAKSATNAYLPSDHQDLRDLFEGRDDGMIPPPPGYEVHDVTNKGKTFTIDQIKTPHLSPKQREQVLDVCYNNEAAFAKNEIDHGECTYMEHHAEIGDEKPRPQPYRPVPAAYEEEAAQIINGLLDAGVIEESDSNYSNALVIVKKPNGKIRICLDLRPMNKCVLNQSSWPIPCPETSYSKLAKANWMSCIDLLSAYHAIKLTKETRQYTAFAFLNRLYHYTRGPYGLCNIPQTFNRVMARMTLGLEFAVYFFDDLMCCSATFEQHLKHLDILFKRVIESGLKIGPAKCTLGVPHDQPIQWLGSIIQNHTLLVDPKKVNAIRDVPIPKTKKALLRFLSAVSYHRRHLQRLADVASPLYELIKKESDFTWTDDHTRRFNEIKDMLASPPALHLPKPGAKFIITTDASTEAAAAVFSMIDETGEELVCGYSSRRFNEAERKRLTVPELELASLIIALNTWSFYLVGQRFTVRTDAGCLLFLHKFSESCGRLYRASLHLQEFQFDLEHQKSKPGNLMCMADCLSRSYQEPPQLTLNYKQLRHPVFNQIKAPTWWPTGPVDKKQFAELATRYFNEFAFQFPEGMKEVDRLKILAAFDPLKNLDAYETFVKLEQQLQRQRLKERQANTSCQAQPTDSAPSDETLSEISSADSESTDSESISSDSAYAEDEGQAQPATEQAQRARSLFVTAQQGLLSPENFARLQETDPVLKPLRAKVLKMNKAKAKQPNNPLRKYFFKEGVLMRRKEFAPGQFYEQIMVPQMMQKQIMQSIHGDNLGALHIGSSKMFLALYQKFYWKNMKQSVVDFVKSCWICLANQPNTQKMQDIHHQAKETLTAFNQRVSMDLIVGLPRSHDGFTMALTLTDEFTLFVQVIPTKTKEPGEIAQLISKHWFQVFGVPLSMHSDSGTEVDSGLAMKVYRILGIHKTRTPAYNPQSNMTELSNKAISHLLRSSIFAGGKKSSWTNVLPFVVMGYNNLPTVKNKVEPARLVFGTTHSHLNVPIVAWKNPIVADEQYLKDIRLGQEFAYQLARKKQYFQPKEPTAAKSHKFEEGQLVMIKQMKVAGDKKMEPKYIGPYMVIRAYDAALLVTKYLTELDRDAVEYQIRRHKISPIRPDTRLVSPVHCKAVASHIEDRGLINPQVIDSFLKRLKLPCLTDSARQPPPADLSDSSSFAWNISDATPQRPTASTADSADTYILPDISANQIIAEEVAEDVNHVAPPPVVPMPGFGPAQPEGNSSSSSSSSNRPAAAAAANAASSSSSSSSSSDDQPPPPQGGAAAQPAQQAAAAAQPLPRPHRQARDTALQRIHEQLARRRYVRRDDRQEELREAQMPQHPFPFEFQQEREDEELRQQWLQWWENEFSEVVDDSSSMITQTDEGEYELDQPAAAPFEIYHDSYDNPSRNPIIPNRPSAMRRSSSFPTPPRQRPAPTRDETLNSSEPTARQLEQMARANQENIRPPPSLVRTQAMGPEQLAQ